MKRRIKNKIAFAIFVLSGIFLLQTFGLYFVISVPFLIMIYVMIIKVSKK